MKKNKILIVEDEPNINRLIQYNLEKAGYLTVATATGDEALKALFLEAVDLIMLDVMLPDQDGFEVCKAIKKESRLASIPIIFLTARGEEIDRIVGLELGAEDYIVKPFSPREMVLRVKTVLKRRQPEDDAKEIIEVDALKIDIARHKVFVKEKEVELTSMEFKLLLTMVKRGGRVQTRDRLLNDVWDMNADVTTRTIDTHIKCLRKKLGKIGDRIETVRGVGYRFSDEDYD
ncbi:MAG: response regulator transcription factor [Candidatus Omnitrophica bacterium]|nr:response regulator transcription factor [Candidatus Omnitrophota bacterium]